MSVALAMGTSLAAIEFSSSSLSSSDDEEDRRQRTTHCAALVVASAAKASDILFVLMCGSSLPGKARNREKGILQGAEQIDRDYFNRFCLLPAPILEAEFEQRFRMPRSGYEVLRDSVFGNRQIFHTETRRRWNARSLDRSEDGMCFAPAGVWRPR
jgi:hypothetical protein